jgi:hypothetical protein
MTQYSMGELVVADEGAGTVVMGDQLRHVLEQRGPAVFGARGDAVPLPRYQDSASARPAEKRDSQSAPGWSSSTATKCLSMA